MSTKLLHSIPCESVPHGELYAMCEPDQWKIYRAYIIITNMHMFPRRPVIGARKRPYTKTVG